MVVGGGEERGRMTRRLALKPEGKDGGGSRRVKQMARKAKLATN